MPRYITTSARVAAADTLLILGGVGVAGSHFVSSLAGLGKSAALLGMGTAVGVATTLLWHHWHIRCKAAPRSSGRKDEGAAPRSLGAKRSVLDLQRTNNAHVS